MEYIINALTEIAKGAYKVRNKNAKVNVCIKSTADY